MAKKVGKFKKIVAIGAITSLVAGSTWASKAFYKVTRVIDGDTFVTTENRYVRLDSVNAPELGNCMAEEAKKELEKLVLNKKVFLKINYVDDYKRLVSNVYTNEGNVGEKMLQKGMATFKDKGTQKGTTLGKTENIARLAGIGIYSSKCTQEVNPDNPKCNIKGNVTERGNYYHTPGCQSYVTTKVQLYMGDKWFCSESEALKAKFLKGNDCK